jgi:uncharacterized membrane protein (UPF0182 family)
MPVQTRSRRQGDAPGGNRRVTSTDAREDAAEGVQLPPGRTASRVLEGNSGIARRLFRRLIIALDRGDLAKLPFSDDDGGKPAADARNIHDRVAALAVPHLRRDPTSSSATIAGSWMMDGYTTSNHFPTRGIPDGRERVNYMRNSAAIIDAYDGTTTFVFDAEDPIIAAIAASSRASSRTARRCPRACASTCDTPN